MDETGRDDGYSPTETVRAVPKGSANSGAKTRGAPPNLDQRVTSLNAALRRARAETAAQTGALADLRAAEVARLEILREQLEPVLAQLPRDCDMFDVAVSPGERPRLFIDQIGFVEMTRDRHGYRFVQDTRHGRIEICESAKLETIAEAVTAYMAHRMIEREKALAADYASGKASAAGAARAAVRSEPRAIVAQGGALKRKYLQTYLFLIEVVGSAVTFGLLFLLGAWLIRNFK
jgi:hypothetical protein